MKKFIFILFIIFFAATGNTIGQQNKAAAEVLYFKANLTGKKADAGNALQARVRTIVEKNWADGKVVFRQIMLSDTANRGLVKRNNAQSQSLVIVVTKNKTETSTNVSALLREFVMKNDTAMFEKTLIEKIREAIR